MEFFILALAAATAFFCGHAIGKETGERETRKLYLEKDETTKTYVEANLNKSHSSLLGVSHIQYPYENPLHEPLSIVKTRELANTLICKTIHSNSDSSDKQDFNNYYEYLSNEFLSELKGKPNFQPTYSPSCVKYLEKSFKDFLALPHMGISDDDDVDNDGNTLPS